MAGVLFLEYIAFIVMYLYFRPIGGDNLDNAYDIGGDYTGLIFEITLWIMNFGYIIYEIHEFLQKGIKEYLNLGIQGQTNFLDVTICILWISLFGIRIALIVREIPLNETSFGQLQRAYVFLWGMQIILLTLRGLALFSSAQYLGKLLKVVKLMLKEIIKFLSLFIVIMVGFVMGLWIITAANACNNNSEGDCADYEANTLPDVIEYIFQVNIENKFIFLCIPSMLLKITKITRYL